VPSGETDIGTYVAKLIDAERDFEKESKIMHLLTGNSTDMILKHNKKRLTKKCKGIIKIQ
jgi:hypothetical protein